MSEDRSTRLFDRTTGGVYAIAPTPFTPDGAVDFASIDRLIDFYADVGVDGVTVLGQLGEAPKLEVAEAREIVARYTKRAPYPVVVGMPTHGFAAMRSASSSAMDAGAAGVMIAPSNTLRTDDEIIRYYEAAAEAVGSETPFIIQDYPLTFSVVMSPWVIRRIADTHDHCVGLKHEDWPGLQKISTLREAEKAPGARRLSILCGNGATFLDFEVERGADGAMTGYCFPEMLISVVNLQAQGERDAAHDVFDTHLPLVRYEQQPGIGLAVRKYVLVRRGILRFDTLRKPSATLTPTARAEVDYLLDRVARRQLTPESVSPARVPAHRA